MKTTLRTYLLPVTPGVLCTAAPSSLLYVDLSTCPREVHWLDLSDGQKPAAGKRVIHTIQFEIRDMCFTQDRDKQLLIVAGEGGMLSAYNTETDELEWKVEEKLPGKKIDVRGVTTDGRGHLFVSDRMYDSKCIQMFSVSDGSYMGSLRTGTDTLGSPSCICWCEHMSSLLCVCAGLEYGESEWLLKIISVQV